MAEVHRSESFANRDAFGHWLSGFVDGEGCFQLRTRRNGRTNAKFPGVRFMLGLRADDDAILVEIRDFLGCGTIQYKHWLSPSASKNTKPQCRLTVERLGELVSAVIPHFDRYPLRAKKRRDYVFWREGALLCSAIAARRPNHRKGVKGQLPKWLPAETERFLELKAAMESTRRYDSAPAVLPPQRPPEADRQLSLFGNQE